MRGENTPKLEKLDYGLSEIDHTVVVLENFKKDYHKQLDMSGSSTNLSLNAELG